jgi:hypothetical protein
MIAWSTTSRICAGRAVADDQLATIARIDVDELMSDRQKCEGLRAIIKSPLEEREGLCAC